MVEPRRRKRKAQVRATGRETRASSFEFMWGLRAKPTRGPRPELSLDAIVRAAVHIADAESLSAVTMYAVATKLAVTTMALYRHVPGKDELLDFMIDSALGAPPDPGGKDWRTEISQWARASLRLFHARPWLLEAVMRRAPIGPNWLAWLNAALQALRDSGLAATEMIPTVMLIDGHVRGTAQVTLGATGTQEWGENFRRVLENTSSDPRYAALAGVASSGGFGPPPVGIFEFGLQRLLDGIESLVRSRAPKSARRR
jgi:AcrR family transcriptional regulator